jgi:hypothetical protein
MSIEAPKIDPRSAAQVTEDLVRLLPEYTRHPDAAQHYPFQVWREYDPATREPHGRSAALIGAFARFGEMLIERLNQVPQKNFLAFLDLLGASREPPQPARVPLTFLLAAGSTVDARVPAGTQVAAPPGPGEKDPVVFETERPLTVSAAQLTAVLTLDAEQDMYGDWTGRLAQPAPFTVFRGERALEHILYLGDSRLFGYPKIKQAELEIALAGALPPTPDEREVQWEQRNGAQWRALALVADGTAHLTRDGTVELGPVAPFVESSVDLRASRWLRCRLLKPITRSTQAVAGMVRDSHLPRLESILVRMLVQRSAGERIAPDLGFFNAAPLDLTKEFFPFGEKPKPNDALLLASTEAFSLSRATHEADQSARIDLEVQLANTHLLPGAASVWPSGDLEIAWECWNGSAWQRVGTSTAPSWLSLIELDPQPLLQTGATGAPSAVLQGTAQPGAVVTSRLHPTDDKPKFLPVGADGRFADRRDQPTPLTVYRFSATYQGRAGTGWSVIATGTPTVTLEIVVPASPINNPSVRLRVDAKGSEASTVSRIHLINGTTDKELDEPGPRVSFDVALAEGRNELLVEAFSGTARLAAKALTISRPGAAPAFPPAVFSDGTCALTQSGVVTLRLPDATAKSAVNGQENFWLRARLAKGNYGREASYTLKDPVKPEEGFTLVPAGFRPPIIAALRIGYEINLRSFPDVCLTYNQLAFEDCTSAVGDLQGSFAPFAAAEAQRPGLYLGFSLPADRSSFPPNTAITLYSGMAAPRYGERAVPLSPEISVRNGASESTANHSFVITNPSAQPETFAVSLLGQRWPASAGGSVTVPARDWREVTVAVEIPAGAPTGESDRGFVRLSAPGLGDAIYSASFATAAGARAVPQPAAVDWHYWDGQGWAKLAVQDGSEAFTRSGLLELLPPTNFARRRLFGRDAYWLRAEWTKGDYTLPPRLARLLPNTTLAQQTTTFVNEVLGSSNGVEAQRFRSTRAPVLAGQELEVREPEPPAAEEQASLEEEEGDDAVRIVRDAAGRPREIWVRWHEVPDFYGSGLRDRHYVIDHLSGEIAFGDGTNGRVPPRGSGNVRLARYQSGGGRGGNRAAGAVAQLKTTVPYVEKATNPEPAAGGAEAETTEALLERMPRTLRHRDRAVTVEDYGDLARLASPEVARALCVPLRDLAADRLGVVPQPGAVSVVVVPATSDVKPLPTLELLTRTQDFLEARAAATAAVTVVGPQYIRVDVNAEVAVASPEGASSVERGLRERLASFLHPLTGGLDGRGWDFGRSPHRSDFFALIESVPGIDHVRYLQIGETEDQPGVRETGRFLVFSGEHRIALVFEES